MSASYGQPPAASQPGTGPTRSSGLDLGGILALVGAALGLIIYFCSFSQVAQVFVNLLVYLLLGAGLLAAGTLLPSSPNALVPAAVLSAVGSLGVLASVVAVPEGLDVAGIVIVVLVLALLQTAALVAAALVGSGVIRMRPRPSPFPSQPWGQQYGAQPGQFPPGQYSSGQAPQGQYGQAPQGQYGQPPQGQYGQAPQGGSFNQPTQQHPAPGQYGQGAGQYPPGQQPPGQQPEYGQPGEQSRPGEGPGSTGPQTPGYGQPGTPPGGGAGPDRT